VEGCIYLGEKNDKRCKSRNYYPSRGGMYKEGKPKIFHLGVSKLLSLTWRDV